MTAGALFIDDGSTYPVAAAMMVPTINPRTIFYFIYIKKLLINIIMIHIILFLIIRVLLEHFS